MPKIAAYSLTEDQIEEERLLDKELKKDQMTVRTATTIRSDDMSVRTSPSSTASSRKRRGVIGKLLRKNEEKKELKRAEKIAASRARMARLLRPNPFPAEKQQRLKELHEAKVLSRSHAQTKPPHRVDEKVGPFSKIARFVDDVWHHHGRPARIYSLSLLVVFLFGTLNAPILDRFKGTNSFMATSLMEQVLQDAFMCCYLLVCAVIHFGILDASLLYAFDSIELGQKSLDDTKHYYNVVVRFATFGVSVGMAILCATASSLLSFLRMGAWIWTGPANHLVKYLSSIHFPGATSLLAACKFIYTLAVPCISIPGTILQKTGVVALLNYTVGFPVHWMVSFTISQVGIFRGWWKVMVLDVANSANSWYELPSWREYVVDGVRPFFTYSAVFLLVVLLWANVLFPKKLTLSKTDAIATKKE